MNDNDRKFGTEEVLKECFHEFVKIGGKTTCPKCTGSIRNKRNNRTFTTPDDAYALEQAITEAGLNGCFGNWLDTKNHVVYPDITDQYIRLTPEQRCQLIIDFYKEQRS
jgi:hypothetical protein